MATKRNLRVINTCPMCGEKHEVWVNQLDYSRWERNGVLIQDAFPYLTADEREIIKTGICGRCWDELFGDLD